jgi:hypothetical protein
MASKEVVWEYMSTFIDAHIDNPGAKEYIKKRWPEWTGLHKYSPLTMIPQLNNAGEGGWELVHMEPVLVGSNHDIGFPAGGGNRNTVEQYVFLRF